MMSQQSAVTSSSRHGWDAGQYLFFANERTQPALDLVARIESEAPARIVDLGCGPGNSTGLLLARWPQAAVTGIDNSPEMLAAAGRDHPDIMFAPADIATWSPVKRYELVFSNAALQWVGDHAAVVGRWLAAVAPGGALAVQMPRNHDFATHRLMRQLAAEGEWRDRLVGARDESPVKPPEFYYDLLAPCSAAFTIWETNYIQIMDGVDAVIAWLHGTGLRPFLARLSENERPVFLDRYAALLAEEYKPQADGKILLPYPRLFFIATAHSGPG
ncbi:MAG: trans-aconitate 2-methyltransferase, partial [Alphaproteobacteria bacterium]|nr:trans-aconitate 2-methyltransferase [Alphaproteobacteria bacterium]